MTKIAGSGSESGSGSISQRHGSADPDQDPPQNVMDPQHCSLHRRPGPGGAEEDAESRDGKNSQTTQSGERL